MKITANEIIPDILLTTDSEVGLNLSGARYLLHNFLKEVSRTNEVNPDCLYEILNMNLEQAKMLIDGDTNAIAGCTPLNTAAGGDIGHVLASLQLMIHSYLIDHMTSTV